MDSTAPILVKTGAGCRCFRLALPMKERTLGEDGRSAAAPRAPRDQRRSLPRNRRGAPMSHRDDSESGWQSAGWMDETPMSNEPAPMPATPAPGFGDSGWMNDSDMGMLAGAG